VSITRRKPGELAGARRNVWVFFIPSANIKGLLKRMNHPVEKNKFGIDALFTQGRPPRHNMTREMTPQPGI
jgi:hypothetical protein